MSDNYEKSQTLLTEIIISTATRICFIQNNTVVGKVIHVFYDMIEKYIDL